MNKFLSKNCLLCCSVLCVLCMFCVVKTARNKNLVIKSLRKLDLILLEHFIYDANPVLLPSLFIKISLS